MISKRLKDLRLKSGKSVKQIAFEIGVSASTYRDWENGRQIRGEPYAQLAKALGASLTFLMLGEKENVGRIHQELLEAEELVRKARRRL